MMLGENGRECKYLVKGHELHITIQGEGGAGIFDEDYGSFVLIDGDGTQYRKVTSKIE